MHTNNYILAWKKLLIWSQALKLAFKYTQFPDWKNCSDHAYKVALEAGVSRQSCVPNREPIEPSKYYGIIWFKGGALSCARFIPRIASLSVRQYKFFMFGHIR